jgi:hypothetical protein
MQAASGQEDKVLGDGWGRKISRFLLHGYVNQARKLEHDSKLSTMQKDYEAGG